MHRGRSSQGYGAAPRLPGTYPTWPRRIAPTWLRPCCLSWEQRTAWRGGGGIAEDKAVAAVRMPALGATAALGVSRRFGSNPDIHARAAGADSPGRHGRRDWKPCPRGRGDGRRFIPEAVDRCPVDIVMIQPRALPRLGSNRELCRIGQWASFRLSLTTSVQGWADDTPANAQRSGAMSLGEVQSPAWPRSHRCLPARKSATALSMRRWRVS